MRTLPSRFDRRRLVSASLMGGAATLASNIHGLGARTVGQPLGRVQAEVEMMSVPMFRGNAERTGVMPGPGPATLSGIEESWVFKSGGNRTSSPAIVDGVAYFGTHLEKGNGYSDGCLVAVDVTSGSEIWRFAVGETSLDSSPAVVDGVVCFGCGDGRLFGVDGETGTERWQLVTGGIITSPPAAVDGVIYVGSFDRHLYAIDAANGTELWRFAVTGTITTSPAVSNGMVFVSCGREDDFTYIGNDLFAVDVQSGLELWRLSEGGFPNGTGASPDLSPVASDGSVYWVNGTTSGPSLYAINAADGIERWSSDPQDGSMYSSPPAVADGVVYACRERTLCALNAADGTERWRLEVENSIFSSPVLVDEVLYVSLTTGDLRKEIEPAINILEVDATTGLEKSRFTTASPSMVVLSSPVVVNGSIYVSTRGSWDVPGLYALGASVARLEVGGSAQVVESTPLRGGPALSAVERENLEVGTIVILTMKPESAEGVSWWRVMVQSTGTEGWVEESKLEPIPSTEAS